MIKLFTFESDGEPEFVVSEENLENATWRAKEAFGEGRKFRLVSQEDHPDWDDFAETCEPRQMLEKDLEKDDITRFFIEPSETHQVQGFNELAKCRRVWTVIDVDGVLWIAPGYHFVNRYAYIVTQHQHQDSESKTYLYHA